MNREETNKDYDFEATGKEIWSFVFADGSNPEDHDWNIILHLESGTIRPMQQKPDAPWKIPGKDLWFQLGLLEKNLWGCAFLRGKIIFGNSLFVAHNPKLDWDRVVDYQPIIAEEYNPKIHLNVITEKPDDIRKTESPIEEIFLTTAKNMGISLVPQVKIEEYRVDFMVEGTKIIIELDGHDYHSTTEQRQNDSMRDRKLTQLGYKVIRFTGKQINADVVKCVLEIIELIAPKQQDEEG
jgi:very-short-patch-repair endonuclease